DESSLAAPDRRPVARFAPRPPQPGRQCRHWQAEPGTEVLASVAGARRDRLAGVLRLPAGTRQRPIDQPIPAGPLTTLKAGSRAPQPDGSASEGAGRPLSAEGSQADPEEDPRRAIQHGVRGTEVEPGPRPAGALGVHRRPRRRTTVRLPGR